MVSRTYSSGFYCKQENCDKYFLRFDYLLRYIKKWHVSDEICNSNIHLSIKSDDPNTTAKIEIQWLQEEIHKNKDYNIDKDNNINFQESKEFDLSNSAQKFIANLRLLSGFTGTAIAAVTNAAQRLISNISDFIQEEILNFCKKQNTSIEFLDVQELLNTLNFNKLLKKTNTLTLQDQIKAFKNTYKYIDPIEIPLGFRLQQHFDRKEQIWKQKEVYETFQYIPIIKTLKLIMSHSSMRNYVCSEQNSSDNLLVNFKDEISYKQHPFFQRFPDTLRI